MRLVALIVLLAFVAPAVAAADVGLITGAEHGTSHQFGLDLKRLVKAAGIQPE